jgi:hypothetical protein
MVCDIIASFELAAKKSALTFLPSEMLDIGSLELSCDISHTFKSKKALEPDALFGLKGEKIIWFALEADRGTEPKAFPAEHVELAARITLEGFLHRKRSPPCGAARERRHAARNWDLESHICSTI